MKTTKTTKTTTIASNRRFLLAALLLALPCALPAFADKLDKQGASERGSKLNQAPARETRLAEEAVAMKETPLMLAQPPQSGEGSEGGVAGACPQVISTYTNASFEGGQFIAQGGFAEQEIAACSYTVAASDFPIRLDLTEMIFATSASTVNTTTKWTVMIWHGTPATGQLVYSASSDGKILPHLVIPAGTNGVNIAFGIDPGDPEQIILQDNGSHMFSIGYRIDDHNNQVSNPCLVAPPSGSNAFPCTDVGGLAAPTTNWLYMLDCGAFGCGAGWKRFSEIPALCRPTGDWVMRASWTSVNCVLPGACCLANGTCQSTTEAACLTAGGDFNGAGSTCTAQSCSSGQGPCCFAATGGCVTLPSASCLAAGGIPGPSGQTCAGYVCFPEGACCLPNGSCLPSLTPSECTAVGGVFQGNATTCVAGLCPEPMGASCFPNGFCLTLTQAQAVASGATWAGAGTNCADGNGNGTADACEVSDPADINNDGSVDAADLTILLNAWGTSGGPADVNGDGTVDAVDIAQLLASWG